jgi:hypothetical protein
MKRKREESDDDIIPRDAPNIRNEGVPTTSGYTHLGDVPPISHSIFDQERKIESIKNYPTNCFVCGKITKREPHGVKRKKKTIV